MASTTDELVARRARALMQHQQVMDEADRLARVAEQARRRTSAAPVFASPSSYGDVRQRVNWVRAS